MKCTYIHDTESCSVRIKRYGIIDATIIDGEWWIIRAIIYREKNRGKGLGGRLLKKLEKVVYKMGGESIYVTPIFSEETYRPIRFYRKYGFRRVSSGKYRVKLTRKGF